MRDRSLGSTIRLKFTTTDSNGAPVAPSSAFVAADFRIYKDGSATEKTTTNGITVTSPFDSVVGRHLIEIDTSNATGDVGFWASGSAYFVELNTAKTVNSQTVSGLEVGSFSLELQTADVRKFGGTALTQSGGRPEVKVASIAADAVNATALAANAVTEIQSGLATSTNVTDAQTAIIAQIDANETKIDSIQSDTNDIQSRLPAALEGGRIAAALDSTVRVKLDASQPDYDLPTNAELATALAAADDAVLAAIAALNNLSAAQVNAELLDVLSVDTFGELSAPPAATSSLKDKLTWLFMWAKNKATETSTQRKLYADNSTTVVSTETVSDDGTTFTKTKAS